jgi:hypothetical protein
MVNGTFYRQSIKDRRMTRSSVRAAQGVSPERRSSAPTSVTSRYGHFALIAVASFGVYWASSLHLEATHRTTHFAADSWFYAELGKGNVLARIADSYHLDRLLRFHPTTVLLAAGWMEIFSPLARWIAPEQLLKALFAAVGAVGACAATSAFSAVAPRRSAVLLGTIYAGSLSIWYFSSIEESKIVTATLTVLYIAVYLHLRKAWTLRGAMLLTAILLVASLNEVVAGFLVVVPVVDTLVQRGWALRDMRWIAVHALAGGLVALAVLEALARARTGPAGLHPEGATHVSMFFYYFARNYYSAAALYTFVVRWFFFSVAAPSPNGAVNANPSVKYGGDFEVALANYFSSPASAVLVFALGIMLMASVLPRYRSEALRGLAGVLLGLLAFTAIRGVFFLIFLPYECMLFSAPVVPAHLLLIGIPFAVSRFPAKEGVLAATAILLLVTNGAFIVGR